MKDLVDFRTILCTDPASMWSPGTARDASLSIRPEIWGSPGFLKHHSYTRYDSTVLVWHHQHLCDARELGEAQPVRACPTGRHHASAVSLHAEAVRAVGGVGVGGDIAER